MYMPDFVRAARMVLADFRLGKLSKINLDEDIMNEYMRASAKYRR